MREWIVTFEGGDKLLSVAVSVGGERSVEVDQVLIVVEVFWCDGVHMVVQSHILMTWMKSLRSIVSNQMNYCGSSSTNLSGEDLDDFRGSIHQPSAGTMDVVVLSI